MGGFNARKGSITGAGISNIDPTNNRFFLCLPTYPIIVFFFNLGPQVLHSARFRCSCKKRGCVSIRKGSIIDKSKLSLRRFILLFYTFLQGFSYKQGVNIINKSLEWSLSIFINRFFKSRMKCVSLTVKMKNLTLMLQTLPLMMLLVQRLFADSMDILRKQ